MKIPLQKGPSHYKDYMGLEVKWGTMGNIILNRN
jgi:hypothetical protein